MPKIYGTEHSVQFTGDDKSDWRDDPQLMNEEDPDDELDPNRDDVIAVLGFDPAEFDEPS